LGRAIDLGRRKGGNLKPTSFPERVGQSRAMPGHVDRVSYRSEHEGGMYSRMHHGEDLSLDDFDGYSLPLGTSSQGKKLWIWAKIVFWIALAFGFFGVLGVWVLPTFLDKVLLCLL
jgi:hypothetical protein